MRAARIQSVADIDTGCTGIDLQRIREAGTCHADNIPCGRPSHLYACVLATRPGPTHSIGFEVEAKELAVHPPEVDSSAGVISVPECNL